MNAVHVVDHSRQSSIVYSIECFSVLVYHNYNLHPIVVKTSCQRNFLECIEVNDYLVKTIVLFTAYTGPRVELIVRDFCVYITKPTVHFNRKISSEKNEKKIDRLVAHLKHYLTHYLIFIYKLIEVMINIKQMEITGTTKLIRSIKSLIVQIDKPLNIPVCTNSTE